MEDTEDLPMDSEYPNFSEGESKVARFVDGSNYWLGTVKKKMVVTKSLLKWM